MSKRAKEAVSRARRRGGKLSDDPRATWLGKKFIRQDVIPQPLADDAWTRISKNLGTDPDRHRQEIEQILASYPVAYKFWKDVKPIESDRNARLSKVFEKADDLLFAIGSLTEDKRAMIGRRLEEDDFDDGSSALARRVIDLKELRRWARAMKGATLSPRSNNAKPADAGVACALVHFWAREIGQPSRSIAGNKENGAAAKFVASALTEVSGKMISVEAAGKWVAKFALPAEASLVSSAEWSRLWMED